MRMAAAAAADVRGAGDNMEIRRLRSEEHGDTRELYEEVFHEDSTAFVDYYYTEKTRDNQIYVLKQDGGIQAMLHRNPYTLMVNGEEKAVDYIVAVATRKEYRKRGFMAALMRAALEDMYREGHAFTFLMPAAEEIYLPHDFRTVCLQTPGLCGGPGEHPQDSEEAAAKAEDAGSIAQMAERYLSVNYQVYAKRDEAYYTRLIKETESDGAGLVLYRKDGELLDCRIVYDEDGEEQKEWPKIMVRIVDVRRMLMSVRLTSLMAACFTVTDPVIQENNRCFVITGTEFSGVMLMEGRRENSEGTLTVAALAELLFGVKDPEELCREAGAELSPRLVEELKKIEPLSRIYLSEVV